MHNRVITSHEYTQHNEVQLGKQTPERRSVVGNKLPIVLLQRLLVIHANNHIGLRSRDLLVQCILHITLTKKNHSIHNNLLHPLLVLNLVVITDDPTPHSSQQCTLFHFTLLHFGVGEERQEIDKEEDGLSLLRSFAHIQHGHHREGRKRDEN